jgi:hypothetical protein
MAPTDRINLPLRWSFTPEQSARDGSIHWSWRAYTQAGKIAMQSSRSFDTLTECRNDAREHGYDAR